MNQTHQNVEKQTAGQLESDEEGLGDRCCNYLLYNANDSGSIQNLSGELNGNTDYGCQYLHCHNVDLGNGGEKDQILNLNSHGNLNGIDDVYLEACEDADDQIQHSDHHEVLSGNGQIPEACVGQKCGGILHGNVEAGCVLCNVMGCDLGNLSVKYSEFLYDGVFVCQHGFLGNSPTCDGDDDDGVCQYEMNDDLVQGHETESVGVFQCGSYYENDGAPVLKVKCDGGNQGAMSDHGKVLDGKDDGQNPHGIDSVGWMWNERIHSQNDGDAVFYRIDDGEFLSGKNDEIWCHVFHIGGVTGVVRNCGEILGGKFLNG